jgi:hypothetical protein
MITPSKQTDTARPDETRLNDVNINTQRQVRNDGIPRQPNDRDESPDAQAPAPRADIQQAARDLADGQVDTDMRGMRGAETVAPESSATSDAAKQTVGTDRAGTPLTPVEKTRGTH